tara:strand:- start:2872 stop:3699 length:828 start_codon:yes stop_codon:yes gene_type:complete
MVEKKLEYKSFLRWAGGKNWLTKLIQTTKSKIKFNNYHEPFLGGGSMFFFLNPNKNSFLSDTNSELINTYKAVKNNPEKVIEIIKTFTNNKDFYYQLRDDLNGDKIFKAGRFIFLNKTSFNGIYRVNRNGHYNVPYGNKQFNKETLFKSIVSASIQLKKSKIFCDDFRNIIKNINENDLVYLDPPYTISHNNNGFIMYNEKLFSYKDQLSLSKMIDKIKNKNAFYILSNAHHDEVRRIYDKGDNRYVFNRNSLVSSNMDSRKLYKEFIFTNIKID